MVNLNNPTKSTWDTLKPDELSHDEFANLLLSTYLAHQNGIDHEQLIEQIKQEVISQAEVAAYRGATEAVEDVVGDG